MRSLSLVMSKCSLSGRGQGHVSNFYIVDLENLVHGLSLAAIIQRWLGETPFRHSNSSVYRWWGDTHNSTVVGLFMTPIRQWKRLEGVMVECTFFTHRPTLILQLHNLDLSRTCRISSFCTVAWQLARFQLTQRIVRSLGDSWASCWYSVMFKLQRMYFVASKHKIGLTCLCWASYLGSQHDATRSQLCRRRLGCGRAAAALWRRRQIWIERRLLLTGRTDTRPLRRPCTAYIYCAGSVNKLLNTRRLLVFATDLWHFPLCRTQSNRSKWNLAPIGEED